ncbi:hypothetical protein C5167_048378 [Papaver somniferum]|uniref:Uncharacterized protein n=1 Tax=Papaver somniferum TaxID=3469 RepID=A0A4Y7KKK6_PAPSO|nr:hypothetical protein C5167_048378 [Papaver somniferum]
MLEEFVPSFCPQLQKSSLRDTYNEQEVLPLDFMPKKTHAIKRCRTKGQLFAAAGLRAGVGNEFGL